MCTAADEMAHVPRLWFTAVHAAVDMPLSDHLQGKCDQSRHLQRRSKPLLPPPHFVVHKSHPSRLPAPQPFPPLNNNFRHHSTYAFVLSQVTSTQQSTQHRRVHRHALNSLRRHEKRNFAGDNDADHDPGTEGGTQKRPRFQSLNRRAQDETASSELPSLDECIRKVLAGDDQEKATNLRDDAVREIQQNDVEQRLQHGTKLRFG